jgi:hypothetical protein
MVMEAHSDARWFAIAALLVNFNSNDGGSIPLSSPLDQDSGIATANIAVNIRIRQSDPLF